jgi:hypothetical protein
VPRRGDANRTTSDCLGLTVLSSIVLALLLMFGGIGQNPVEGRYTLQLCVLGAKLGIQCELCGRWYHYSCGSVKAQGSEREKWNCKKCRIEKVRMLQEKLQNAM